MDVRDRILRLSIGDHLCCIYETEEEHRAVLAPFLRSGLEQGHKILYVVDARTAETVMGYLEREGLEASAYIDSGRLVLAESRDTYTRGGVFDPDSMLELLHAESAKARDEGFEALRVTGEMSWALRGLPGSDRLMEYEGKLNQFFPGSNCIGLCQYDMRRFEPDVLLDVLATHPIAIVHTKAYDNVYYMPPEEFLGPNRLQAELKRRIQNLEERSRVDQALRKSEAEARREAAFSQAVLDTAAALILVLDNQGRIIRFNRTCERLTGFTASEMQGENLWERFVPEEEAEGVRQVFQQLTAGQFPNRYENEVMTKSGDRVRVAWANTCLTGEDGAVEYVVSIGLDVTELALVEQARQREHASLATYSKGAGATHTASSLGVRSLRQGNPAAFDELMEDFRRILGQTLEEHMYKVDHRTSQQLRSMADRFGQLGAGPRDVIQVYIHALDGTQKELSRQKEQLLASEGRLMLVELMGFLATHYQNHCLGKSALAAEANGESP
ncbi:MAG: MEDS domain-containing protein [Desulfovibrionaceae bacterium]